jgi:sporulation protein YlmC with PRC-barrel domain
MMLAMGPAVAQSNPPTSTMPSNATDITPGSALEAGHFVRTSSPNQWRASKLIGLDVYGSENEKIGDIIEVLIDKDGNEVVVLGIGGFLGIARREIAVPFKAVDWRYGPAPTARSSEANSPGPSADATVRKTVDNTRQGYPDFAFVAATKESLKAAPEFKYETEAPRITNMPQAR